VESDDDESDDDDDDHHHHHHRQDYREHAVGAYDKGYGKDLVTIRFFSRCHFDTTVGCVLYFNNKHFILRIILLRGDWSESNVSRYLYRSLRNELFFFPYDSTLK